jgi:hypothetical protein
MMNEEKAHINYSAADIEKYYRGEMPAADMHAMEKAALDDPFLSEAMEGYEIQNPELKVQSSDTDLNDLKRRLAERVTEKAGNKPAPVIKFSWWKVAAVAFLFLGAGWLYISKNIAQAETVNKKNKLPVPAKTDSAKTSVNTDTSIVAGDLAVTEKKQTVKNRNLAPAYKRRESGNDSMSVASASQDAIAKNNAPEIKSLEKNESLNSDWAKPIAKNDTVNNKQLPSMTIDKKNDVAEMDKKTRYTTNASVAAPAPSARANVFSNTFNGTIVDEANRPLANATIQIPHLNIATVTNDKGYFSFRAPDTSLKVSVASVGFETQNLELTTNSIDDENINNVIRLKPSLLNLNEAAVGYGTQKKTNHAAVTTKDVTINILDAEPSAGWNEYNLYLGKNKKIPGEVKDIHGEVVVSFIVGNKNSLRNFSIEKSLNEQLDTEAIRLIKEGPSWKLLKGKKAKVSVTVKF